MIGVALALAVGWGSRTKDPTTIPVWIDSRFSSDERRSIEQAVSDWQNALGDQATVYVASEEMERPSKDRLVQFEQAVVRGIGITIDRERDLKTTSYLGWVSSPTAHDVHLVPRRIPCPKCPDATLRYVAEHEIGHALGLRHTVSRSLMGSPCWDIRPCIDPLTLDFLAVQLGLDRDRLRSACL